MRRYWTRIVRITNTENANMSETDAGNRLVDDITNRVATRHGQPGTATAILGPFWRADTPVRSNGSTIVLKVPEDGQVAWMYGQVTCSNTGKPLANASVDVWQASTNGMEPLNLQMQGP